MLEMQENKIISPKLSFFWQYLNYKHHDLDTESFLFCSKCKDIPLIKPINTTFQTAIVSCKCNKLKKEMTYEEISDKFLITLEKDTQLSEYIICENHKHIYKFYCDYCEKNLCEECNFNHECDIKYIKDLRNIDNNIKNKKKISNSFL